MKKIFALLLGIGLLAICCNLSYAAYGVFDDSFMTFEARDADNNQIESSAVFQQTAFSKAVAMFSSFGICRWQNKPIDITSLGG